MLTKYTTFIKENFDDPYNEEVDENEIINIGDLVILTNDKRAYWSFPHWMDGVDDFITASEDIGDTLGKVTGFRLIDGIKCVRINFETFKLDCVKKKL